MKDRIHVDPKVHFGKPCVAGTRIKVLDVLELVEKGIDFETIVLDYFPVLEPDDIRACLRYAINVISAEDVHVAASS